MSNINSYVWKDARISRDKEEKQVETRLVDMDEDQLQMIYTHCKEMLYNPDPKNAGRMIIIDQISKQLNDCGAELALRYFKTLKDKDGNYIYSEETLLIDIKSWLRALSTDADASSYRLQDFLSVPAEYRAVSLKSLEQACRDNLGAFNHSKITHSFLFKLGIYLTQEELRDIDNDLLEHGFNPDKITMQEKINNHIKFPLGIPDSTDIRISPHGLSGAEFRDMVNMKKMKGFRTCKYSELSTSQLHTLRFKVLRALEERTAWQAKKWKEIMAQIEEVARYNHYKLC